MAATAANVYYGYCVESSLRENCDGYDIINLLEGSDGWIQIGGLGQINSQRLSDLFNRLTSDAVENALPGNLNGLVAWVSGGQSYTPIAWGNYYFGTEGYVAFSNGNDDRLVFCERNQGFDSDDSAPYEYLFVITNTATGNPKTNYEGIGTPTWFVDGRDPGKQLTCDVEGAQQ